MDNIIIIFVVLLIVAGASLYIYREKKKGKKCIGCPDSGKCPLGKSCSGCSCSCNK